MGLFEEYREFRRHVMVHFVVPKMGKIKMDYEEIHRMLKKQFNDQAMQMHVVYKFLDDLIGADNSDDAIDVLMDLGLVVRPDPDDSFKLMIY